jgi:hypothetical protein
MENERRLTLQLTEILLRARHYVAAGYLNTGSNPDKGQLARSGTPQKV